MKIHIASPLTDEPWGGGNQFLKALRKQLRYLGEYEDTLQAANVVIVNSKDNFTFSPIKTIIHRIDGVFGLYRGEDYSHLDNRVYNFANTAANGIILQSEWSKKEHVERGLKLDKPNIVIHNAVDPDMFYIPSYTAHGGKIRLIASSWSTNPLKGFKDLVFLDNNLDWSKFKMSFYGRLPDGVTFKNIKCHGPVPSMVLATALKDADIYVTGTMYDTCSNAILEAQACGCFIMAKDSGGNKEIIEYGNTYENVDELIMKLMFLSEETPIKYNSDMGMSNDIAKVTAQYLEFIERVHNECGKH